MSVIELEGWAPGTEVLAAEMAVVGAAILSKDAADTAAELVKPGDFYTNAGVVFAAAVALAEDGKPVDAPAVLAELASRGELERVGGGAWVSTLIEQAAVAGAVAYHARKVAADATRRRVHVAGEKIRSVAASPGFDPDADADLVRKTLDEALATSGTSEAVTAGDLILEVLDELETKQVERLTTGYKDLDHLVTIRPGAFIVVGARPGVGKSVLGIDLLRSLCVRRREPGLLISLEMSRSEVMHRLIAAEARVNLKHLQDGELTDEDWQRIAGVHERIGGAPLVIDDTPNVGLAHVRARLRGMLRTTGCRLVVVDYLQLMQSAKRVDNRAQEVAEFTRGLKLIAREFGVPLVAAAQVNRESEHRTDKRPQMSDLRESGAIEADADIVMLLHREEMYEPEGPRAGEIDIIVAKQRQGPRGTVTLGWQGHYQRMVDLAKRWTPTAALGGAS